MSTLKFWLVFSVGVAAGATVALICAPQTGAKTRKQLKRKANDAGDYLKDQLDDAGDYLKDQASTLGEQASKVYRRGKGAAAEYADDAADSVQSAVKGFKRKIS